MTRPSNTSISIKERQMVTGLVFLWVVFIGLSTFIDFIFLKSSIGFFLLLLLPGIIFLQNIKISIKFEWSFISLAVGVSLVLLMLFGLLVNAVLPIFGVIPLIEETLRYSILVLLIVLSAFPFYRNKRILIKKVHYKVVEYGVGLAPMLLVIAAICGALRLNNGHTGLVTLLLLFVMAFSFAGIIYFNKYIKNGVLETMFYFYSLSLLLMTSLRGWDVVGHDIQREYRVFQMTKQAGVWSIDYLHDAYNACMSITILPTMLSELLTVPDAYVYKVLFQIVFALTPVVSFILISRYFSKLTAILSTIIIISFPTFFTDMPMLNRQEIAFLMFALLSYVMLDKNTNSKLRNGLILVFSLGIILSHYSTTYIVILFLMTAWFGFWCFKLMFKIRFFADFLKKKKWIIISFSQSKAPAVSLFSLILVIFLSFAWSSVFTQTSDSSIKRVLVRTFESIVYDSESTRSSDTLYSLFSSNKMSKNELLSMYKTDVVDKNRHSAPEGTFLDGEDIQNYKPVLLPDQLLPLTDLGKTIESFGVSVTWLNMTLKFGSAKVLQFLLLLGMIASLFSFRYLKHKLPIEYIFLVSAGVIFLAAMVLVPVLSVEYGVLRAFQQTLFVGAPFIVVGGFYIFNILGTKISRAMTTVFVISFFLISTGAITQTTGGYKALLHLNNSGPYYDYYYIHDSEIDAISWVNNQIDESDSDLLTELQADRYFSKKISEQRSVAITSSAHPGLISTNAFVLLGYSNMQNGNTTIFYNGTTLSFKYPFALIEVYKNKIYDSNNVVIYR